MRSDAANLEVIVAAIKHHQSTCPFDEIAVELNPYEVERLGWDEVMGLPIRGNSDIGTGRVRVVCAGDEPVEDSAEDVIEKKTPAPGELVPTAA